MRSKNHLVLALALAIALPFTALADEAQDQIVAELLAGNAAFASDSAAPLPDVSSSRRAALVAAQHPKAAVLSCADSRVPPEHVFRQGLGDLFVERIAGNVAMSGMIASAEYAVEHLGVHVLVVLGHHKCGAVAAAVDQVTSPSPAPLTKDLSRLVDEIEPAVLSAQAKLAPGGDLAHDAVHANARLAAQNLVERSKLLRDAVRSGELTIVVAVYDLATGVVTPEPFAVVVR